VVIKSLKNVASFKYLEITLKNKDGVHAEIRAG
jgi:hypothetical protein